MAKGPGLYRDIGKKARDLLYKDYQADDQISITFGSIPGPGFTISSSESKKGELFPADVKAQLKNKKNTTYIKCSTTITLVPWMKSILSFTVPDQKSGKVEHQFLHDYVGISTSAGLTENPIVNLSGVVGTKGLSLGTDVSLDTKLRTFSKFNVGLSFTDDGVVTSYNLNNKGDALSTSYYRSLGRVNDTAFGLEATRTFSTNEHTFTIGTKHQLDEVATVKARVNNVGKATALLQYEWHPNSVFTLSGEVDTKALNKGVKFGWAVKMMVSLVFGL